MADRTFTDAEAAEIAKAFFQKRVQELAKSLDDLKAQELTKAAIPTHADHKGMNVSGGTSDLAAGKIDKPGKIDTIKAAKSEVLCKECGKAHGLEKCGEVKTVAKAMLKDAKGKEKDNGIHPDAVMPEDKKSTKVEAKGSGGDIKSGKKLGKSELAKAAKPPMAKPPSGVNMGTAVPTSKPAAAPKVKAPAPVKMTVSPDPERKSEMFEESPEESSSESATVGTRQSGGTQTKHTGRKEATLDQEMSKSEDLTKANPRTMNMGSQMSRDAHAAATGPTVISAKPAAPAMDPTKATQSVMFSPGQVSEKSRASVMQAAQKGVFNPDPKAMNSMGPTIPLARNPAKKPGTLLPSAGPAKPAAKPGIFGRLAGAFGKGELDAGGNNPLAMAEAAPAPVAPVPAPKPAPAPVAMNSQRQLNKEEDKADAARQAVKEMKDRSPKIQELEEKAKKLATPSPKK